MAFLAALTAFVFQAVILGGIVYFAVRLALKKHDREKRGGK